jgi:hypothetical protein
VSSIILNLTALQKSLEKSPVMRLEAAKINMDEGISIMSAIPAESLKAFIIKV